MDSYVGGWRTENDKIKGELLRLFCPNIAAERAIHFSQSPTQTKSLMWTIRKTALIPVVILLDMVLQGGTRPADKKKLYVLEDAERQQWCAYSSVSLWKAEVQSTS